MFQQYQIVPKNILSQVYVFTSLHRDLMSWISSMKGLIAGDELATDVTGAEALLERQQEHRNEIDARSNTFQAFELFGQQLLQVHSNYMEKEQTNYQ